MPFSRNFSKSDKFGYLNPIMGKLEVIAHWKAHGRVNYALIKPFSLSITVPEL